jgi:hypothetical protein
VLAEAAAKLAQSDSEIPGIQIVVVLRSREGVDQIPVPSRHIHGLAQQQSKLQSRCS